ncbi:MAG: glycosyltransferase family 2 protein [Desulfobacterales bacterium]|jgi:undecaprenyl-phosphate 4-deoxy-4-formamido-L-arabinose transferase
MLYRGLSVIVPVYNSEQILPDLMFHLQEALKNLGHNYEVILVNDGSADHSWNTICKLAKKYDCIRGINFMRNFGQHNALLCGIRAAEYDTIVTIDDDLQHPPQEIPKLLNKLDENYDVVYGTPRQERHGLLRDLASKLTKLALQSAMSIEIARNVCAFRAFRTQLRDAFSAYKSPFVSIDVLLTWGTTRFGMVSVRHESRPIGKSNYTSRKLLIHAMNMITGFSVLPLQVASIMGLVFTIFGMLLDAICFLAKVCRALLFWPL